MHGDVHIEYKKEYTLTQYLEENGFNTIGVIYSLNHYQQIDTSYVPKPNDNIRIMKANHSNGKYRT